MQFFPVDSTYVNQTAQAAEKIVANTPETSFSSVISSFIEEGRTDYSGRPAGFSGYSVDSGTIAERDSQRFATAMRKHGVDEGLVQGFETLVASGKPVTLGTAYKAFSGKGRVGEELEGEERAAFKSLLGRMGLSKEEQDELLSLSDEGDIDALIKRLETLVEQDGISINLAELKSLLSGLDMSDSVRQGILGSFDEGSDIFLDAQQLKNILNQATAEQARRSSAVTYAKSQMRDIMADILATKKNAELAESVDSSRGNRRSEQSESLMHDSVRKNTGLDKLAEQKQDGLDAESENDHKHGKSRSERILETAGEAVTGKRDKTETAQSDSSPRIIKSDDSSLAAAQQPQPGTVAQGINAPRAAAHRQEIFSQVEHGILHSAQNGAQRLTLQLNPVDLGQLTVVLSVHQGEVKATIRAENADTAGVLREQMVELKQTLEAQGLKVKELDVQTGLQENNLAGQWDGHQGHNLMRDASERDRMIRLARIRRDSVQEAGISLEHQPASRGDNGLHIVA